MRFDQNDEVFVDILYNSTIKKKLAAGNNNLHIRHLYSF